MTTQSEFHSCDHPLVELRETGRYGLGVFAKVDLVSNQQILHFDGPVYRARFASDLPNDPPLLIRDRAIQIAENHWKDSVSVARYVNHSCRPNAGIGGISTLVTLTSIQKGEEITFDYDMTEDSDWRMICNCGSENCRSVIRGFRHLPAGTVRRYGQWLSDWLIQKYRLAPA